MRIDYCKLTEDLLPLYVDGLLSEETKGLVEGHLEQCEACREKYRHFRVKVPEPADVMIVNEEGTKYESAKQFLLKIRKQMYRLGSFALVAVLIAMAGSFLYGKSLNDQGEKPIVVSSVEDFAGKVVPGWQRAQEAGQVVDLGISEPIPGTEAVITFEKVWYNSLYTYVLYTVTEPKQQYLMAAKAELEIAHDQGGARYPFFQPLPQILGGVSSEGYHQVLVFDGFAVPVPAGEITLTIAEWMEPKAPWFRPGETVDSMVSVKLPLSDQFLQETLETVPLERSFEWMGRKLRLTGMEVGSSKTLLHGEATLLPGEALNHINGALKAGQQYAGLNYESIVPGDAPNTFKFTFYTQPFNQWPVPVSLEIRAIEFSADQDLNFALDWTEFAGKEGEKEIPKEEDGAIQFYDSIVRMSYVNPARWVEFEIVKPQKRPYITLSDEPAMVNPGHNYTTGLKVTNEKGEILEVGGSAGGHLREDKFGIGFEIEASDARWQTSERIFITIGKPNALLVIEETVDLI